MAAMKYRTLRIAWSVWWGIVCLLVVFLSAHTARNQVKAAVWVSRSHYVTFVAFRHWLEVDAQRPDWEPRGYFHSNYVDNPPPLVSPKRSWHVGSLPQTGTAWNVAIRIPLWLTIALTAAASASPWISTVVRLRRFSLRTLLIATTLVALVLGLIAYTLKS
jgi:hypothetical protein